MKKFIGLCALLLILVSLATAAPILVTDSGVSVGNDNTIGERRSSWDVKDATEYIVAWMKIPLYGDLDQGKIRYKYKVNVIAPDRSTFSAGPFQFDNEGYAKYFNPVTTFSTAKTTFSPKPCQGEWKFEFMIIDLLDNNKEDLGALVPFYLTGSDEAQAAQTVEEGTQRAVDDTVDMSTLALFNTAKQFGAQQEQQRQLAATTTTTTVSTLGATTTTIKKVPAKNKTVIKK